MTEQELSWLTSLDPHPMLAALRARIRWWHRLGAPIGIGSSPVSERKLRLFGCACCRLLWAYFLAEGTRTHVTEAVETSERYADGLASQEELRRAGEPTQRALASSFLAAGYWITSPSAWEAAERECEVGARLAANRTGEMTGDPEIDTSARARFLVRVDQEKRPRADLLREIFGNPFRPVSVKPGWQTATVVSIAHHIYADRAFDCLPILADALEDAGCTQPEMQSHCRGEGEHVRGCWVIDRILGKE